MRNKTKLWVTTAMACAAHLAVLAPAGQAATICNEAENSHRGGYVVSGGIVDPNPPARLRGSQMRVGNDKSRGLSHAADRSPALRQCGLPGDEGPSEGGGAGEGDA
jgi:hypothetical protein